MLLLPRMHAYCMQSNQSSTDLHTFILVAFRDFDSMIGGGLTLETHSLWCPAIPKQLFIGQQTPLVLSACVNGLGLKCLIWLSAIGCKPIYKLYQFFILLLRGLKEKKNICYINMCTYVLMMILLTKQCSPCFGCFYTHNQCWLILFFGS